MKFSILQLANLSPARDVPGFKTDMRYGGELPCAGNQHTAATTFAREIRIEDPMT